LLDQNVHPAVLARGYRLAAEKAQEILNSVAENIDKNDKELLKKIALTAMTGKGAEAAKEILAKLVVDAVTQVAEEDGKVNKDNIKIEKKVGKGVEDTELVKGVVIEKERAHPGMPKKVENAKIALIDCALEIKSTEIDAKIQITDPNQIQAFIQQEEKILNEMVEKIAKTGANVVFCQKGIDDVAQHFLAKKGIFAARRVKESDMKALAKATGARIITNLDDLTKDDLGTAGIVEEIKIGDEEMIYVKECKNPKSVTILVRGGTEHVVDEVKRAVEDAIGDVIAVLRTGKVVAGAGAPEIEVARQLRDFANTLSGREQLAVQAFAESIEIIPRTLAENAGLDPIDILAELKAAHEKGNKWAGVDVFSGKVINAWETGIIEPLRIKTQALKSASEAAILILRIDDVIAGGKEEMPGGKGPGAGGYGGYGEESV